MCIEAIDTSFVKKIYGRDCVGRNPTDRGRKATKLSALVAADGVPLALAFFPATLRTSEQWKEPFNRD
jgi:hypothetical protein